MRWRLTVAPGDGQDNAGHLKDVRQWMVVSECCLFLATAASGDEERCEVQQGERGLRWAPGFIL